jgi:hypothetical protein
VTIDDMIERDDKDLVEIYANPLRRARQPEADIIIGHQDRDSRMSARGPELRSSRLSGKQVFLSIRCVKVAKDCSAIPASWAPRVLALGRRRPLEDEFLRDRAQLVVFAFENGLNTSLHEGLKQPLTQLTAGIA